MTQKRMYSSSILKVQMPVFLHIKHLLTKQPRQLSFPLKWLSFREGKYSILCNAGRTHKQYQSDIYILCIVSAHEILRKSDAIWIDESKDKELKQSWIRWDTITCFIAFYCWEYFIILFVNASQCVLILCLYHSI